MTGPSSPATPPTKAETEAWRLRLLETLSWTAMAWGPFPVPPNLRGLYGTTQADRAHATMPVRVRLGRTLAAVTRRRHEPRHVILAATPRPAEADL